MEKINWVRKDQMHLTLAFLGDTEENTIPGIVSGIETVMKAHHSFTLSLSGLGIFRNIHDPRVIWTGCEAVKEFRDVKRETDTVLSELGFETDERPFSPHLTLGRIKLTRHPNHLAQLIGMYTDTLFQTDTIRKIILYESRLTTDGPEYSAVHTFILG
jgi:2'-5' RNA ligase